MNPTKLKVIEDIIAHLSSSQGKDLKSLLDESKAAVPGDQDALEEVEGIKPKGISVEKVSVLGKGKPEGLESASEADPLAEGTEEETGKIGNSDVVSGDEEMTDDELQELLKKYLSA